MRKERRARIEILLDIMQAIKEGEHVQTRLMYKANVSHHVLEESLQFLDKAGLIFCRWESTYSSMHRVELSLSPRGFEVLKGLREAIQLLKPDESIGWVNV